MNSLWPDLQYKMYEYSDFELAFLLKNRFKKINETAQESILKEVKHRNLSPAYLADLIEEKLNNQRVMDVPGSCSRCTSEKLVYPSFMNKDGKNVNYICQVCEYINAKKAVVQNSAKAKTILIFASIIIAFIVGVVAFLAMGE